MSSRSCHIQHVSTCRQIDKHFFLFVIRESKLWRVTSIDYRYSWWITVSFFYCVVYIFCVVCTFLFIIIFIIIIIYILHIHYIFLIIYLYIFIIINLFQLNYSKIEFVFDYCLIITWSIFLWNEFIWSFFYRLVDYFNFENEKNFNIDSIFYIFKEKFDVLFLYRIYLFYSIIFIWYILSFQQYLYFYNEHLS